MVNEKGGQWEVAHDQAVFTGKVTNYGLFKNTHITITFAGGYEEWGTYFSDPARTVIADLLVGEPATCSAPRGANGTSAIPSSTRASRTHSGTLNGGGFLAPVEAPVPMPSSGWLMASGLLGPFGLRKRQT